jgi:hypothetical protein
MIALSAIFCGCRQKVEEPVNRLVDNSATEETATIDEAAMVLADVYETPIRSYSTFDFGRERDPACRSVIAMEAVAVRLLPRVRESLPKGYIAFVGTTRWLGDEKPDGAEVVVAKGESQFDILRVARSDAVNYDMLTEDLCRKLDEFDRKYGIEIFHAETDTIEFGFNRHPSNMKEFGESLYEFCPDIVDQGTGSVDALVEMIRKDQRVFLWWD